MYRPRETWVERDKTYTVCSVCQRLLFVEHRDTNGACCFCEDVARVRNAAELEAMTKEARAASGVMLDLPTAGGVGGGFMAPSQEEPKS